MQAKLFVKLFNLKNVKKVNGTPCAFYDNENGIAVVHQSGHLLELMPPEFYEAGLRRENNGWNIEDLPVLPELGKWKFKLKGDPKPAFAKRIKALFEGIKWALVDQGKPDEITLAVDNDKEGELLGWEVLDYLKVANHPNITRMLYSQLTVKAVKKAYDEREPGSNWFPRYQAGLARLFADWLIGMNVTIGLSVENKEVLPPFKPLHSGRVIFAICHIIHSRHIEIENYVPRDYFNEVVTFKTKKGETYIGRVVYPEKYLDKEIGKLTSKETAEKIHNYIMSKSPGKIVSYEKKDKKKGPPLGFHRTGLDIYLNKKYGFDLKTIANALQKLYSELSYVTYPRVSVKNLDVKMHSEMPSYVSAMAHNLAKAPQLTDKEKELYARAFKLADLSKQSSIWKKGVDDDESHHAIIPTDQKGDLSKLNEVEFIVYRELADRLIIQFLPDYEYQSTTVETNVGGFICKSSGTTPQRKGWKGLYVDIDEESEGDDVLPPLVNGQSVDVSSGDIKSSTTVKPKLYTQATLLADLESPSKFVGNKELMKKIKKLQIGTDGTREPHLTQLHTKEFVEYIKEGKGKKKTTYFKPTKKLIKLTEIAPGYFKYPETSAYWEDAFNEIQAGRMTLESFYAKQSSLIKRFFQDLNQGKFKISEPTSDRFRVCPDPCGGYAFFRELPKKDFNIWSCSKCRSGYIDKDGQLGSKLGEKKSGSHKDKPDWTPPKGTPKSKCPDCSEFAYHKKLEGKSWSLWECSGCKASFFDDKGKIGKKMAKKKGS